jgi:hypothetical protein
MPREATVPDQNGPHEGPVPFAASPGRGPHPGLHTCRPLRGRGLSAQSALPPYRDRIKA